jgi:zinc transporter ZupT
VGVIAAALGVWLTELERRAKLVVAFSAGVLLGVVVFGLLPELAIEAGWTTSLLLFGAGYGLLITVDRYIYPICPTCTHDHDHSACKTELHGFAAPLVAAASIHSFLDGWSIVASQWAPAAPLGLRVAVPLAIGLHKVPEGIALGAMLFASVGRRPKALLLGIVAEGATLIGGAAGLLMAPQLGSRWILYPLGITAGWVFYLGFHAVHEEWKRRGPAPAFVSALTGIAGAAVIQRGAEALFR